MRKAWTAVGAIVAWFALLLQLYLTIHSFVATGRSVSAALVLYLSFFTILTNLLIASLLASISFWPHSATGRWFSRASVQAASATYIVIVGVTYALLLRNIWDPQGWQKLADILLHDVDPCLYVGYWLIFAPKRGLRWSSLLWWLIYPLLYLFYSLARGAVTGEYPYPFINAATLGYPRTLTNAAMLMVAFVVVGGAMVLLAGWLDSRKASSSSRPSSF